VVDEAVRLSVIDEVKGQSVRRSVCFALLLHLVPTLSRLHLVGYSVDHGDDYGLRRKSGVDVLRSQARFGLCHRTPSSNPTLSRFVVQSK